MKYLSIIFVFTVLLFSCGNEPEKKAKNTPSETPETRKNYHVEYYPGTKQLKIEGATNDEKQRNGMWKSYNPVGGLISMTAFKDGKKHGVIIVNYDSGIVRYTGEYTEDNPSGVWKFYNEDGTLAKEENYDK